MKLFMLVVGCSLPDRFTEQHDVFFGIGNELKDLVPALQEFWPAAGKKLHIDAWREVTQVDGYNVSVVPREASVQAQDAHLYFINLGGYKREDLEEYHYKMIVAARDRGVAIQQSKQTAFYKHMGFQGATSHVDDKYGVDVDDIYEIADILTPSLKEKYRLVLSPAEKVVEDEKHQGYFKLDKL